MTPASVMLLHHQPAKSGTAFFWTKPELLWVSNETWEPIKKLIHAMNYEQLMRVSGGWLCAVFVFFIFLNEKEHEVYRKQYFTN